MAYLAVIKVTKGRGGDLSPYSPPLSGEGTKPCALPSPLLFGPVLNQPLIVI